MLKKLKKIFIKRVLITTLSSRKKALTIVTKKQLMSLRGETIKMWVVAQPYARSCEGYFLVSVFLFLLLLIIMVAMYITRSNLLLSKQLFFQQDMRQERWLWCSNGYMLQDLWESDHSQQLVRLSNYGFDTKSKSWSP